MRPWADSATKTAPSGATRRARGASRPEANRVTSKPGGARGVVPGRAGDDPGRVAGGGGGVGGRQVGERDPAANARRVPSPVAHRGGAGEGGAGGALPGGGCGLGARCGGCLGGGEGGEVGHDVAPVGSARYVGHHRGSGDHGGGGGEVALEARRVPGEPGLRQGLRVAERGGASAAADDAGEPGPLAVGGAGRVAELAGLGEEGAAVGGVLGGGGGGQGEGDEEGAEGHGVLRLWKDEAFGCEAIRTRRPVIASMVWRTSGRVEQVLRPLDRHAFGSR